MTLTAGSLFSGIGGLDLGLERAGMEVRWQVENDPYCNRVLAKHWPDVPRYGDIKELDPDDLEPVDLICGGFPCQPVSLSGHRRGAEDERWLWPEYARIVDGLRPRWVVVENVPGLRSLGLDAVLSDLVAMGFRCRPVLVPACAVGAPHMRSRLFVLAHAATFRCEAPKDVYRLVAPPVEAKPSAGVRRGLARLRARQGWSAPDAGLHRVGDGFPSELDTSRVAALGNAVVPQVAEYVGRCIVEFDRERAA